LSYQDDDDLGEGAGGGDSQFGNISFSGTSGEYSWKDEDGAQHAKHDLEVVFGFEMLNGRVLWGGSGPIPEDGNKPLCRAESATADCAGLRPNIGPATLATMIAKGWTGNCSDCALGKFQGDQKSLCKTASSLFVALPEDSPPALRRISFANWSSTKALEEKIRALKAHCKKENVNVRTLVLKLGSEKKDGKTKGQSYRVPTLSIKTGHTVDDEFAAMLLVEARMLVDELRTRPSWAKDPKLVLRAPETQAALMAKTEMDGLSVEEIPF